jgi:glyoxylase-like metal-dependent hydrolase (beta-lactamase superfamily II)
MAALCCVATASLVAGCGGGSDDDAATVTVPQYNGLAAAPSPQYPSPAATLTQFQLHLADATANAGTDPLFVNTLRPQWCYNAEHTTTPPELQDRTVVPITKVFDDVYYTGYRWVGQYVFKTNQGLFLLDTLNNTADVQNVTEPQLASIGLDSATIFAALPTHGHGDHFGGAGYLQSKYRTPIYLGSADKGVGATANPPFIVTPVSSDNLQPQPLVVGDLQMTLLSTPGHTPGTLSGVIPVKHNGVAYKVAFWGGTALAGTEAAARQYLDGTERLYKLSQQQAIDGTIHTHPFVDGSLAHLDEIKANGLGTKNPFLIGKENALRSLTVLRNCAAARVAQINTTAVLPEWRFSTIQAAATWIKSQASNNLSASARVNSPFGAVNSGTLTFTFAPGKEQCTANIDAATGVATCTVSSTSTTQQQVSVSYAGANTDTLVNLPATGSAEVKAL